MSFKKRQNEYCNIPGFDASKGERIHKAFRKLLKKIQYLEQSRASDKSKSEASHCSKDEDLTLTDIQYSLLILQLQYVRSLLRKRCNSDREVFTAKSSQDEQNHKFPTTDKNIARKSVPQDTANEPYSTEILTATNSGAGLSLPKESSKSECSSENVQIASDCGFSRLKHSAVRSTVIHQNAFPSSSKPHYHLKLDDVPFILGASSAASHSVVANVQNIIARMKSHNKALCGPKPNSTRSTPANTHSTDVFEKIYTGQNFEEFTKTCRVLTDDLCALAAKHKQMMKIIDAKDPDGNSTNNNQNHGNEISYVYEDEEVSNRTKTSFPHGRIVHKTHRENDGSKIHRSYSTSEVKLHAEVKKIPKVKGKDFVNKHVVHTNPKESAHNVKHQTSNMSIMDRRKLLRSLQNCNRHLSAEDISWD